MRTTNTFHLSGKTPIAVRREDDRPGPYLEVAFGGLLDDVRLVLHMPVDHARHLRNRLNTALDGSPTNGASAPEKEDDAEGGPDARK